MGASLCVPAQLEGRDSAPWLRLCACVLFSLPVEAGVHPPCTCLQVRNPWEGLPCAHVHLRPFIFNSFHICGVEGAGAGVTLGLVVSP